MPACRRMGYRNHVTSPDPVPAQEIRPVMAARLAHPLHHIPPSELRVACECRRCSADLRARSGRSRGRFRYPFATGNSCVSESRESGQRLQGIRGRQCLDLKQEVAVAVFDDGPGVGLDSSTARRICAILALNAACDGESAQPPLLLR